PGLPGRRCPQAYTRRVEHQRDSRATMLVLTGVVVGAVGIATIGIHPHRSIGGRATSDALLLGLALATAAVAFTRYRSIGDTHPLFVGAALLVVSVQTVLFAQRWSRADLPHSWGGSTIQPLA